MKVIFFFGKFISITISDKLNKDNNVIPTENID